jgi:Ni/Co efflux regulator RcnB
MNIPCRSTLHVLAVTVAALLAAGPVLADPPPWAGGHREERGERHEDGDRGAREEGDHDRDRRRDQRWFEERHRSAVNDYYTEQYRGKKKCPPGLAKKHNGCVPPGHARKWQVGEPLPRDVRYYPLPQPLVQRMGPPPEGHKFVRVAGDVLLIAIGSSMVVDAIQDLGH